MDTMNSIWTGRIAYQIMPDRFYRKGENLEMIKLDTVEGNVSIEGKINSFYYTDNVSKENSLIMKLFKWSNLY